MASINDAQKWLSMNRLTQEVPGVPVNERWHIWDGAKREHVWYGPTQEAGETWAAANGVKLDEVEYFEP